MNHIADQPPDASEMRQILAAIVSGANIESAPFLDEGLTFGQLYTRAYAMGNEMARERAGSSPLCLCSPDRAHTAATLIASLISGTTMVIPYAYDPATLQEARKSILYTRALVETAIELPEGVTRMVLPATDDRTDGRNAHARISMDSPWVYLYTGGSTGTPRIWSKTPRNLLMEALYLAKTFRIGSNDTILATVPANHIYGLLYSVLLPLVTGARVCAATPSFPNEIETYLRQTRATVLISVPAHYRALKAQPIAHHHLRTAFSSAGALAEKDSIDFYTSTGIAITEIYGSTETGGIAQRTRGKGETALTPFGCVDVKIEHEHLQVRSPFLSKELAATDEGFFETADRAAWKTPSGFILLGRSDGIVKVGGKRVDLAKTRETLMQLEGVMDAYIFAIPVQSGRENEIIALVEGAVTADQIIKAANPQLPPYARPRQVKVTRKIPLTSTGKYDREAIIELFKSRGG